MTTTIIITLCILILLSYAFDLSSKHTKIPTVILLFALGWSVHEISDVSHFNLPDLKPLLPILGTIGLILIVLEGSLELEIDKSRKTVLRKATLSSLIQLMVLFFLFGYGLHIYSQNNLVVCLLNAIPFCIISSAIAIPSVQNFNKPQREFVIYESSLSDIFGVIIFNFLIDNETISLLGTGHFILQFIIMLGISFLAGIGLAFMIKKIDHPVKYVPIIMMIILIYNISKIYHLPALIFILLFGLFLNNLEEFKQFGFIRKLEPEKFDTEIKRFSEIVAEIAFVVRTIFFILFGYLIDLKSLLDINGLLTSLSIVSVIFLLRLIYLWLSKIPLLPFLFIAPRGLITILLFISIPISQRIPLVNESLMIQVILISAIFMMAGSFFNKKSNLKYEKDA